MAEERDVPMLEDLVNEVDAIVARLDASPTPATAETVMSELKNTILPLIKDIAASTMLGLIEIHDEINPVKLSGEQADETAALLKAFAESTTDAALKQRIAEALEPLEEEEDDGDEESETN